MKKYILAFALIVLSFFAFSQDEYNCYKLTKGYWNNYSKKWEYEASKKINLRMKIYKNIATINDEAQSRYEAISIGQENKTADYDRMTWDGIDEKGRSINIQIVFYKESKELVYMAIYDDVIFVYHIVKSSLSTFNQ